MRFWLVNAFRSYVQVETAAALAGLLAIEFTEHFLETL